MKIIGIEEHLNANAIPKILDRINDMDRDGIDMQVLSMGGTPRIDFLDAKEGLALAKSINETLYKLVEKYPKRFSAFAAIAIKDPDGAAKELERAITQFGFGGTMIAPQEFFDDQIFWPVFEMAEKLDVPVYIHPEMLRPDILQLVSKYPWMQTAAWGFAIQTGLHSMRLIASGVFDRYPRLKIILGHLGEAIPYWLWRIDKHANNTNLKKKPSEYFKENYYVTTSGMFYLPALMCCYSALGADRIVFGVDYPIESNKEAVSAVSSMPIDEGDKQKIFHLNAEKLLKIAE